MTTCTGIEGRSWDIQVVDESGFSICCFTHNAFSGENKQLYIALEKYLWLELSQIWHIDRRYEGPYFATKLV